MVNFSAALSILLGLASASPTLKNQSMPVKLAALDTGFWYANMDHSGSARGYAPDLDGDYTYPVYMAVSPGADAKTIQTAITTNGKGSDRNTKWLASQPRVVYLPSGTYVIDRTLTLRTDTILMGDATNPPTLKAAAGFNGDTLFDGQDPATAGSGEQSFSVGLKNVILDTTAIDRSRDFVALAWGIAQGAQLQNVKIHMPRAQNGRGHTGIRLGRGSALGLADVRIEGGQNGIHQNGHQQALYKSIYFYQNAVGFLFSSGHTATLIAPTFDNVKQCVVHNGDSPFIGVIDGKSTNADSVFYSVNGGSSVLIDNFDKDNGGLIVSFPEDRNMLSGLNHVDTFTYGNTVGRTPIYGTTMTNKTRPGAVAPGGRYPVIAAPNFAGNTINDFINVKDKNQNGGRKVLGDNTIDEAGVLNEILAMAAESNKIAYFPFGKYRVESTLFVPPGSRIVGEGWATITGAGNYFKKENDPKPVISVGREGEIGVAQIQDMRFTVSDVLPGAIIVQFNMAGNQPGDVGMWNSLVTIGGTRGADALSNKCNSPSNECKAALNGIHLTKDSSAYIENVWNWVADHAIEGQLGTSIAAKGGVLVESTKGTWLHALGSEHWWLYQLNLFNAENVLVSMLQSETNYDQGDHTPITPPAPWKPDSSRNDPDFSHCKQRDTRCRMGFGNYITGGKNIYHYTSASWAFFSGPGYQKCADGQDTCQNYMHWISQAPENIQMFGVCAKDSYAILHTPDFGDVVTHPHFTGSWGGDIGRYSP
ncbi:hypothetical protein PWT90_05519 [Aphanocladium album]|nr:hypothetical protein PWT90_05519 [Aphanocladium album]